MHIAEARELRNGIITPYLESNKIKTNNGRSERWPVFGRDFFDYMDDLRPVVNRNELLERLGSLEKPIVVDLCSGPDALVDLFNTLRQPSYLGISVGFADRRTEREQAMHTARNIHHISGDLMDTETWAKVRKSLSGQKADLIMEMAYGAVSDKMLRTFPLDARLFGLMVDRAWRLLENNGTMLFETPTIQDLNKAGVDLVGWKHALRDAKVDFATDINRFAGFVRITKSPDSPQRLPLLS